jgi:predicted membrane-bound spermidine synthase
MPMLGRLAALLASLWLGLVFTLGAVAAPAAFAVLERPLAGRMAGQCFRIEAQLSLGLALILLMLHRRLASQERATSAQGSVISTEILLVLGALFCTVLGYFALQPAMEAARAGQGTWSFGAIHGASSALYALKGVLLFVLVWRGTKQHVTV